MDFCFIRGFFFIAILCFVSACNTVESKNTSVETTSPSIKDNIQVSNCPRWKSGQTIKIVKNTTIPSSCSYQKVSFSIEKENIVFDCNGADLNGLNQKEPNALFVSYSKSSAPRNWAFSIWKSGVKIKNCKIKNYLDGIVIRSRISKRQHQMLRNKKNITTIERQLRADSPQNIIISNTTIDNSHKHGIYVQRYANHLNFINSEIKYSGNSAIYLDSGSQYNSIRNSYFYKNGYTSFKNKKRMRMPKLPTAEREAIAVDSSAYNEFINNRFENNGKGGIFFYKNCFEKHQETSQLPRFQHSNDNKIQNNRFINERYGVWLASRQSKQLSRFKCGDSLMYKESSLFGSNKYYHDYSKNNKVSNNIFKNVVFGIIVEDDNNQLVGNSFSGRSNTDILIGTAYRSKSKNQPVIGVQVKQNKREITPLKITYSYGSKPMKILLNPN